MYCIDIHKKNYEYNNTHCIDIHLKNYENNNTFMLLIINNHNLKHIYKIMSMYDDLS